MKKLMELCKRRSPFHALLNVTNEQHCLLETAALTIDNLGCWLACECFGLQANGGSIAWIDANDVRREASGTNIAACGSAGGLGLASGFGLQVGGKVQGPRCRFGVFNIISGKWFKVKGVESLSYDRGSMIGEC